MDRLIVIATPEELKLIKSRNNILITGVGGLNVIRSLQNVPRSTPIYNIGYAGSNSFKVGEKVSIGRVKLYHPNVQYKEPEYNLFGQTTCYTSNDFVLNTELQEPCVFDMELAFILAMGFRDVVAHKVVSDNLSFKEYKESLSNRFGG